MFNISTPNCTCFATVVQGCHFTKGTLFEFKYLDPYN